MSSRYPVPSGYLPMSEAISRARLEYTIEPVAKLHGLLIAGELKAWTADQRGTLRGLRPEFWTTPSATAALKHSEIWVKWRPTDFQPSEGRPVFLKADLDRVLPSADQREELASKSEGHAANRRPGGAPPKAGIDDFWVEACRLVHEGKQGAGGQTQAAFVDAMHEWSETNQKSDPYSLESVADKIKKLWKKLGLGKNG